MTQLMLFNETSRSRHADCKAVMCSLCAAIGDIHELEICGRHGVVARAVDTAAFERAEIILVNGGGTLHHDGSRANHLLDWVACAKAARKPVLLVNALFQQYVYPDTLILTGLAWLSAREQLSAAFARSYGGALWVLLNNAGDPRFLGAGRVVQGGSDRLFVGATHPSSPWPDPFPQIEDVARLPLAAHAYEDIVATLETADLYLAGQHHGVYAAALAGCPFVATPGNSHKIGGFIDGTGLPLIHHPRELEPAIQFARRNRSVFAELHASMAEQRVFDTAMLLQALQGGAACA